MFEIIPYKRAIFMSRRSINIVFIRLHEDCTRGNGTELVGWRLSHLAFDKALVHILSVREH